MIDPLAAARSTLQRAATLLASGLGLVERDTLNRGTARVMANGLRELDGFLNLLVDAAAVEHGLAAAPKQHNTANKLRALRIALDQPDDSYGRLRALGRAREWLYHCGGTVARDARVATIVDWRAVDEPLSPHPHDRCIANITPATLPDIGRFYGDLATSLVGRPPPQPTISSGLKK